MSREDVYWESEEVAIQTLSARAEKAEAERDAVLNHLWGDGPDGSLYHCKKCGISKTDDHDGYSCLTWLRRCAEEEAGHATRWQKAAIAAAATRDSVVRQRDEALRVLSNVAPHVHAALLAKREVRDDRS